MKRLIEQTACEHGWYEEHAQDGYPDLACPGGTSREVTVDYEAAARNLHFMLAEQDAITPAYLWSDLPDEEQAEWIDWSTITVDAALGGGQ